METFVATILKIDINPYVRVPASVLRPLQTAAGKTKGPIPVKGKLEGKPFTATVVKFRGLWRLYLNTEMRRSADCDVGDTVRVEVEFDDAVRAQPIPELLAQRMSKNAAARRAFELLTPSRRKEILNYLNNLKTPESLERNIERLIGQLEK